MNKAAVQYIQLVCLYRLILIRYYFLFNLVSLLDENEEEQDPSLEKAGEGENPLKGNGAISAEAYRCSYFYHGDHLGSSNYITDRTGRVFEHTLYLPYGETWIDEGHETSLLGYKSTGKELDEETGYYYFGARYYDPQVSSWISTDPALPEYMPNSKDLFFAESKFDYKKLAGQGGIYNTYNMNLYAYGFNNPIKFFDPDGKKVYSISIGVDIFTVGGGGIGVAAVWDDKGNWGLALSGKLGVGVKVAIDLPGLKNIAKFIYEGVKSSSVGIDESADTIYDLSGTSYNVEGGMVGGFKSDLKTGKLKEVNIGSVGGGVTAEQTIVVPLSKTLKAIMNKLTDLPKEPAIKE